MNFPTQGRLAFTTVLILAMAACESRLTGNEGNFQFSYDADDRVLDFNKPIAVGARLDIDVNDVGARRPVSLTSANMDDTTVLNVSSFNGQTVTVEGMGDGQALLTVAGTTSSGAALTDSINLLSRVPEVHRMWHTCTEEALGGYLADTNAWVGFDLEMANSQPVIGYGYYPITPSSPELEVLENTSQSHMWIGVGSNAATHTITSNIDDTTLDMAIVTPGQIDGVVEPVVFFIEAVEVGETNSAYVLPSVGGMPVCQANLEKTVATDTPDACTVNDRRPLNTETGDQFEFGWFEIVGLNPGMCRFTVTYPAGNEGAGASAEFEVTIEP